MDASPSGASRFGSPDELPAHPPQPMTIHGQTFVWGSRTFLMGIINVTPDSFSGDGIAAKDINVAVDLGRRMFLEGADILDVGGESSRPGHTQVAADEELARVIPVVRALREALPETPLSIDTVKPVVASAALDAGADLVNDVAAVGASDAMARLVAERQVPYVLMHGRAEPRYTDLMAEVSADLQRALERALSLGVAWERLIVDPGIGFGKTAEHNLMLLGHLAELRLLGRPVLLGTSRKSTIGKVLDLPAAERQEGTLATTALAVASGVDLVRVHDVEQNRRAALVADAITRPGALGPHGWQPL